MSDTISIIKLSKPKGDSSKAIQRIICSNDTTQLSVMNDYTNVVQFTNDPIYSIDNDIMNMVSHNTGVNKDKLYWTMSNPYGDYATIYNSDTLEPIYSVKNKHDCTDSSSTILLRCYDFIYVLLDLKADIDLTDDEYKSLFRGFNILTSYDQIEQYLWTHAKSYYNSILDHIDNNNDLGIEVQFNRPFSGRTYEPSEFLVQ